MGALCFLALSVSFTSCSDDDDVMNDNGSKVELPSRRAYILYEGMFKAGEPTNDTGIAFFAPNKDKEFIADIYQFQNGKSLGNLGQSMVEEDDFIYVTVSTSSSVIKLNEACVEVGRCDFPQGQDPRFIVAEDGFLFVTHYGGSLSKIDARTMKVVKTLQLPGGQQMEGIAECNGKLYVANAYTPTYEYLKDVFVVNPQSLTLESTIQVADNPKTLIEEEDQLFVLSLGNYKDVQSQMQVIDPRTQKVTSITPASFMAKGNHDRIFLVKVEYDANWQPANKLFFYDAKSRQLSEQSFLKNAPKELLSGNIYMISVDDDADEIYVGITDYSNPGTIYRFDGNGNLKDSFSAGGVNPNTMLFVD